MVVSENHRTSLQLLCLGSNGHDFPHRREKQVDNLRGKILSKTEETMDMYCVIGHGFRVKQKEDEAKELSRMQSERKKRKKV